jgi:hypothetical protein
MGIIKGLGFRRQVSGVRYQVLGPWSQGLLALQSILAAGRKARRLKPENKNRRLKSET